MEEVGHGDWRACRIGEEPQRALLKVGKGVTAGATRMMDMILINSAWASLTRAMLPTN